MNVTLCNFMQSAIEILKSVDFWQIAFPAFAATVAWFWNERSKLTWEQYKRKEEHYKELLRCLKGFYLASHDTDLKNKFLNQMDLLWLSAPDTVIRVAYKFLEQMADANATEEDKKSATGALIEAIRKDLLARKLVKSTTLSTIDYKFYISKNLPNER